MPGHRGPLLLGCALALLAGCGKKGPPLPPIVRIPASADVVAVRRVGAGVYVTVAVPAQNVDQTRPADVERVEVYGVTSRQPLPAARVIGAGPPVAVVHVAPPAGNGAAAPEKAAGTAEGERVTVRDELGADDLTPPPSASAPAAAAQPPPVGPLRRFYVAIAFSARGRPGPPGRIVELPLTVLPDAPLRPHAAYTATTLSFAWDPSGGLAGFLLDRAGPVDTPPVGGLEPAPAPGGPGALPPGPSRYNVYKVVAPDPVAPPAASAASARSWDAAPPQPVNSAPLAALQFEEPVAFDGRERCYTVRTVRGEGAAQVEGLASSPVCVTPVDTFPPAPPGGARAIAGDGAVDLIWEPNSEPDLAGYLVLRGAPGDDTLTRLTRAPIAEARFTDRAVTPGTRYVYAVVAVDDRLPLPNVSGESSRVDITAK
jgi:hypothetical protein